MVTMSEISASVEKLDVMDVLKHLEECLTTFQQNLEARHDS